MNKYHPNLTLEKWQAFPKEVQILNIASEFSRIKNWLAKNDEKEVRECLNRAFELIDLTIGDSKWNKGLKELLRFRELLADFYIQPRKVNNYFLQLYRIFLNFTVQSSKVKI